MVKDPLYVRGEQGYQKLTRPLLAKIMAGEVGFKSDVRSAPRAWTDGCAIHRAARRNCGSVPALQLLTFENFASHLNSTFALKLGESTIDLTLTQATKHRCGRIRG